MFRTNKFIIRRLFLYRECKVCDFLFPVLVLLFFYLFSHPPPRLFSPQRVKQFIFSKLKLKTKSSFFDAEIKLLGNIFVRFYFKTCCISSAV